MPKDDNARPDDTRRFIRLKAAEAKAQLLKRLDEITGDRTETLRIAERLLKIRSDLEKMKNIIRNKKL